MPFPAFAPAPITAQRRPTSRPLEPFAKTQVRHLETAGASAHAKIAFEGNRQAFLDALSP